MRLLDHARQSGWLPDLADVFVFGGIALVGYGLYCIYPPAAWIVTGAALFWLGLRG